MDWNSTSGAFEESLSPLRSVEDVAEIERIPFEQRAPFSTTYELIRATAERLPDRPALTILPNGRPTESTTFSYRHLLRLVTQAANLFHKLGLKRDESVSILLPNIPEFQIALWGAEAVGRGNPINPMLDGEAIAGIVRAANTKILITLPPGHSSGLYERAKAACPQEVIILVVVDRPSQGPALNFHAELAKSDGTQLDFCLPGTSDAIAALYHTGGTTGHLKLVTHSHRNEIANAWQSCCCFGLSAADVVFNAVPLFHVTGTVLLSLAPFAAGAHVVMGGPDGFRTADTIRFFWDIIAAYRVSVFCAVPTVYVRLLGSQIEDQDISSLRFAICGAAPLPPYVIDAFQKKTGAFILEGYGMTESCSTSFVNPRDGERRVGAVGIRAPYQEARIAILDRAGGFVRDAEVDEPGALLMRGPNITPGYLPPSANENSWPLDGWLDTGDTARIDGDGYLFLTGRKKDLIIRSGHNIDPAIVENSLAAHPAVAAVAAVGFPDAYAGELPVAYVVRDKDYGVTERDLLAYAREHASERPAAPARIFFVEALPLTSVGKVFKPTLRLDATRRACSELLAPLLDHVAHDICVSNDRDRGFLVSVALEDDARNALSEKVRQILGSLALACEIECLSSIQS